MIQLLENTNEQQQQAILCKANKIKIIAGAGTGKTKTLTLRYAYLVSQERILPKNILCVTFTNKAANEMKNRISAEIANELKENYICTLHSFCVKILMQDSASIGILQNFKIMDEVDEVEMAKIIVSRIHGIPLIEMDQYTEYVQEWLQKSRKYKKQHIRECYDNCLCSTSPKYGDDEVFEYIKEQKKNGYIGFDDIIEITRFMLQSNKCIKNRWAMQFQHVLIDEAQDCNQSEWDIINVITSVHGKIFAVGDPDQCIYEWREAEPKIFMNMQADETIILSQNYRSMPGIIQLANSVISINIDRLNKNLTSVYNDDSDIQYYPAKNQWDESKWVVEKIKYLVNNNECAYQDIFVLARSDYQLKSISTFLYKNRVPYVKGMVIKLSDIPEIRIILSIIKAIINPDDIAFNRLFGQKIIQASQEEIIQLKQYATDKNISIFDATLFIGEISEKIRTAAVKIKEFHDDIDDYTITGIVGCVIDTFEISQIYSTKYTPQILDAYMDTVKTYEASHPYGKGKNSISEYINDTYFQTNEYICDGELNNRIKVMTVHQAKGLESMHVFVVGMNDGQFPNDKTLEERKENGEEEERRLMYVACTRAEKGLYLSSPAGFSVYRNCPFVTSRFVIEGKAQIKIVNSDIEINEISVQTKTQLEIKANNYTYERLNIQNAMKPGAFAKHTSGEICEIEEYNSGKNYYTVTFLRSGKRKKIKAEYLENYQENGQ